jgi:hypothetical protein
VGGGDGWYVRLKHTALAVRSVVSCAGVVGAAMARLARKSGVKVENFMVVVVVVGDGNCCCVRGMRMRWGWLSGG